MELTTLGAALSFAIDLETQAMKIYEARARDTTCSEHRDIFLTFSATNGNRKAMLERTYKENVYSDQDTGIFEPIPRLKSDDYKIHTEITERNDPSQVLILSMEIEENSQKFYQDLANGLGSGWRTNIRTFEKMAWENNDRRLKLKSLHEVKINQC
jgi:rubrerythrin